MPLGSSGWSRRVTKRPYCTAVATFWVVQHYVFFHATRGLRPLRITTKMRFIICKPPCTSPDKLSLSSEYSLQIQGRRSWGCTRCTRCTPSKKNKICSFKITCNKVCTTDFFFRPSAAPVVTTLS